MCKISIFNIASLTPFYFYLICTLAYSDVPVLPPWYDKASSKIWNWRYGLLWSLWVAIGLVCVDLNNINTINYNNNNNNNINNNNNNNNSIIIIIIINNNIIIIINNNIYIYIYIYTYIYILVYIYLYILLIFSLRVRNFQFKYHRVVLW